MNLQIHPLALAFPEMDDSDYANLKEDIRTNGQREPVILLEGQVLDGRHRAQICSELGLKLVSFNYAGNDPVGFVQSANLHRRHLTPSQRASAVVACSEWMEAHRPPAVKRVSLRPVKDHTAESTNKVEVASTLSQLTAEVEDVPFREAPKSNVEMAREAGVSTRTITDAKAAHKAGLSEAIRDGALTASEAATVARAETDGDLRTNMKPAKKANLPRVEVPPAPVVDLAELEELREKVDFLADENTQLTDRLAVHFMEGTADEKAAAADLIDSLRGELSVAAAELDAVKASRDGLQNTNAELLNQVKAQRRAIERLEKDAKAAA